MQAQRPPSRRRAACGPSPHQHNQEPAHGERLSRSGTQGRRSQQSGRLAAIRHARVRMAAPCALHTAALWCTFVPLVCGCAAAVIIAARTFLEQSCSRNRGPSRPDAVPRDAGVWQWSNDTCFPVSPSTSAAPHSTGALRGRRRSVAQGATTAALEEQHCVILEFVVSGGGSSSPPPNDRSTHGMGRGQGQGPGSKRGQRAAKSAGAKAQTQSESRT